MGVSDVLFELNFKITGSDMTVSVVGEKMIQNSPSAIYSPVEALKAGPKALDDAIAACGGEKTHTHTHLDESVGGIEPRESPYESRPN